MGNRIFILLLIILALGVLAGCSGRKSRGFEKVELPENLTENDADLLVRGKIKSGSVFLDRETIVRFPETEFTCFDPWDKKEYTYTGVSIPGLLEYLGIDPDATKIIISAENDYSVPVRMKDLKRYDYILAYKVDGMLLGTEESFTRKGKLMVAIDFEKHSDLDVEVYKNQLVWQVNVITVE